MEQLVFKFEGLDATNHTLPMYQAGNALIGLDRIINSGLIFLATGKSPKRGQRFDLVVQAREPEAGSYTVAALLQHAPYLLPVLQDFIVTGGVEAAYRFAAYVLTRLGGRPAEANMHLDALLQMNRDHLEARDRGEARWHESLHLLVDRLSPAAKQAVLPVGKSATDLALAAPAQGLLEKIDEPMADAIRSKAEEEVGDMLKMKIDVDGIIHHNKQLKIVHPDIEGRFITAIVRDPLFDSVPNPYSEAAASLGSIEVMAKPVYRGGKLERIYVMDIADG